MALQRDFPADDEQWDDAWFNEEDDEEDTIEQQKLIQSFANRVMKSHKEGTLPHAVGMNIHANAEQHIINLKQSKTITEPIQPLFNNINNHCQYVYNVHQCNKTI